MARGDLTDQKWALIGPFLPPERGRWAHPSGDNHLFFNGMLHVLRTGCPWRDMHERYGRWNSVYVRFRRWAEEGVWDALLQTLIDLELTDDWQHMVESTVVCAHSQATGAKGVSVGEQVSDYKATDTLMMLPSPSPRAMLADRSYDSTIFRQELLIHGILPVILSAKAVNLLKNQTSGVTGAATASNGCSAGSSRCAVSQPVTTRLPYPS